MAASQTAKTLAWLSGFVNIGTKDRHILQKLWPLCVLLVATGLALAIDIALGEFFNETAAALYILAAAATAYYAGWRFGIVSMVLGLVPNIWLSHTAYYSLAAGVYGTERLIINTIIGSTLAVLVGRLRKQQDELRILNNELEDRVRHRTAELEESNRQLEAFCHTLAHDLRAPLRAIQGFSEITLTDNAQEITAGAKETLSRVGTSAEMMGRLIHDLLTYTQLNRTEIELTKTSLQEVLERVLQILAPEICEKKADIHVDSPLPVINGDFVILEQIILSILSNALKFTRDNTAPKIKIWAESSNTRTRLFFQDDGIGIDPQYHERIFGPFQRLDPRARYPGTGMGLAIAKKSLERVKGTIGVDSEPDHGSCFWIDLPNS